MTIEANKVVSIEYTLYDEHGAAQDSTDSEAPMVYLHGAGSAMPGLERGLAGKAVGDEVSIALEAADAFGDHAPQAVSTVSRDSFDGAELEVGAQVEFSTSDGETQVATIKAINGDQVTIDANHPLAGQKVRFEVKVLAVRDATADEIANGAPQDSN
ncbi:peptidylprolyl isomerase [Streptomyces sp. NPDC013740]|uniref:FKBP-type peptidyl-prolyl cis-trans isomerase n=1 Tax=Streptomyces sp. NPDC013740 TaxID=3364867 RepID=UPI00370312B6